MIRSDCRTIKEKGIFYGWWIVISCFFIFFFRDGTVGYGFTAFFDPIAKETGWSHTQISIAASLRGVESAIFAPITGFLVDRFGPKRLMFFGVLIMGSGVILLSQVNSLSIFYFAFILVAIGTSAASATVMTTAVANWFRRDIGKALAITLCGMGASGLLIPVVVWLIEVFQWRTTFIIIGVGMWLICVPLTFIIKDKPEQYGYLPDGESISRQGLCTDHNRVKGTQGEKVGFEEGFRSRALWMLSLAELIRSIITQAVSIHIMPYLSSVGMPRQVAALLAGSIPLLSIIGRISGGWIGDILDKKYVMAGSYFLAGIGLFALSHTQQLPWLMVVFLVFYPLLWGAQVLRGSFAREYFKRSTFGKMTGIMVGLGSIGGISGPFVAGWSFDTLGSYQLIWQILAYTSLIGVVLIFAIKPPKNK